MHESGAFVSVKCNNCTLPPSALLRVRWANIRQQVSEHVSKRQQRPSRVAVDARHSRWKCPTGAAKERTAPASGRVQQELSHPERTPHAFSCSIRKVDPLCIVAEGARPRVHREDQHLVQTLCRGRWINRVDLLTHMHAGCRSADALRALLTRHRHAAARLRSRQRHQHLMAPARRWSCVAGAAASS